jgi:hypothetical protein
MVRSFVCSESAQTISVDIRVQSRNGLILHPRERVQGVFPCEFTKEYDRFGRITFVARLYSLLQTDAAVRRSFSAGASRRFRYLGPG